MNKIFVHEHFVCVDVHVSLSQSAAVETVCVCMCEPNPEPLKFSQQSNYEFSQKLKKERKKASSVSNQFVSYKS